MFKDRVKFLGLCILLGMIILSVAIIYHANLNKFYLYEDGANSVVFDKSDGTMYYYKQRYNFITRERKVYEEGFKDGK